MLKGIMKLGKKGKYPKLSSWRNTGKEWLYNREKAVTSPKGKRMTKDTDSRVRWTARMRNNHV